MEGHSIVWKLIFSKFLSVKNLKEIIWTWLRQFGQYLSDFFIIFYFSDCAYQAYFFMAYSAISMLLDKVYFSIIIITKLASEGQLNFFFFSFAGMTFRLKAIFKIYFLNLILIEFSPFITNHPNVTELRDRTKGSPLKFINIMPKFTWKFNKFRSLSSNGKLHFDQHCVSIHEINQDISSTLR